MTPTPRTDLLRDLLGALILTGFAVALLWRIRLGANLSDESYYIIFVDDWLKGGMNSSTLLTLHQTAEVLGRVDEVDSQIT